MAEQINFKHISVHDAPEHSIGFLLWRISTTWRSSIEAILHPLGLTHPQFVVLSATAWLTRNGAKVSQVEISNFVELDPNTTSQILRGLEKKRLIERNRSIDEKRKNPAITAQGAELLVHAMSAVEQADGKFFAQLSQQESRDLLKIFHKLLTLND